jgi:uncharacterized protein YigE (DUF2233 family)
MSIQGFRERAKPLPRVIRIPTLLLVLATVWCRVAGAEADSVQWDAPEVIAAEQGLILERQRWRFGDAAGYAWKARTARPGRIRVVAADAVSELESLVPSDEGPWAAINGGFYDENERPMGLVVSDGVTRNKFRRGGGSGVFLVTEQGPQVVHRSDYQPDGQAGVRQAVQSIDRMIDGGRSLVQWRPEAPRAARSAVAISEREIVLILLADDRSLFGQEPDVRLASTSGFGLPLWAFSEYVLGSTAAKQALNLDGSRSSQLTARIGGGKFRIRGVAGTINALILRPN